MPEQPWPFLALASGLPHLHPHLHALTLDLLGITRVLGVPTLPAFPLSTGGGGGGGGGGALYWEGLEHGLTIFVLWSSQMDSN